MSDNLPAIRSAVERAAATTAHGIRYGILLTRLTLASTALQRAADAVNGTYDYVADTAATVDRLADTAAAMNVDTDTIAEHHDAAAVMRSALDDAEALAADMTELSRLFEQTANAHAADYGPVAEAAQRMTVPMADRNFYRNN